MYQRRRIFQLTTQITRSFTSSTSKSSSTVQHGTATLAATRTTITRSTVASPTLTTMGRILRSIHTTTTPFIPTPTTTSTLPLLARNMAAAASLPPHTELLMPALSPTMAQGNIVTWKKKEGDQIQPGDVYCEIETDKSMMEWESQEEGYLAKILMPEGSKNIPIGTMVAIVVEEPDDLGAFKDFQPGSAASSATTETQQQQDSTPPPPSSSSSSSSFPPHTVMSMPALSPTMAQGNILAWKKQPGDEVQPGDILAEVETDKSTMEWEAQEEGVIAQLLVAEGTHGITIGSPVMVMVDDKEQVGAFAGFTLADAGAGEGGAAPAAAKTEAKPAAAAPAAPSPPKAGAAAAAPRAAAAPVAAGQRVVASPYARKLAAEAGISLAGVGGSGPHGRIVAADVQQLLASGGGVPVGAGAGAGRAAAAVTSAYTDVELNNIKRVTAKRLLESKQTIPHYYLNVSCRVDALQALRARLNSKLAATNGGKLSVNDFVVKAASLALKQVPEVNASWHGDFIRQYHNVDCAVAVQTPAGLMVPVVKNSDKKGLSQLATEVRDLATRAKEGKLAPEEMTGATFTISNLGMFGVNSFAAIVNPPQACILAVGSTETKVVPGDVAGQFEAANYMTCTLSCDHRVVDGAVGAQWLKAFKTFIEDPDMMLL